ncbi:TetR/AcrR family transcriptional regulator [Paenibacillus sp. YYML68]|uniref:TetR/AcrR family transcriptional regulator n=1 Tax=Paenibacillus sp. YYML68 TaxID=2909250 RepID=UPI002492DB00|nr:TetR/AcrR family transcriptional regulator [Paenibacillus sp. YYML68]
MRPRDDNKVEAIFEATVQLVNEIGFAETSISKIARTANVSAATIYIYHENKEDLLIQTYLRIKRSMSEKLFHGLDSSRPVKERFEAIVRNYIAFIYAHQAYFLFLEQIRNSPLLQKWCLDDMNALFQPVFEMFDEGKRQLLLKQADTEMLMVYAVYPIAELVKEHMKKGARLEEDQLNAMLQMSWDAIQA